MIHCVHSKCAHSQSHMIYDVRLTQHNEEIARMSPDPFPLLRAGSGDETNSAEAVKAPRKGEDSVYMFMKYIRIYHDIM